MYNLQGKAGVGEEMINGALGRKKVSGKMKISKTRIWFTANWRVFHNDPEKRHRELSFGESHTSLI